MSVLLLVATVHAAAARSGEVRHGGRGRCTLARSIASGPCVSKTAPSLEQLRGLAETYEAIARKFSGQRLQRQRALAGRQHRAARVRSVRPGGRRRTRRAPAEPVAAQLPGELADQPDRPGARTLPAEAARSGGPVKLSKPLPRAESRVPWPVALVPETRNSLASAAGAPDLPVQTARDRSSPRHCAGGGGRAAARRLDRGRSASATSSARASTAASGSRSRWTASRPTTPSSSSDPRRVFFDLKDTRPVPALLMRR